MANILVVDDEPCVRDICVQYLSMEGYEVDASESGEEALEAAAQKAYDLLILDLRMQGMDGLTTFQRVKSVAPRTKAVVVSGSTHEYQRELDAARGHGLLGVLPKPFDLSALSALVASAIQPQMQAA